MNTTSVKPSPCPQCGKICNAATPANGPGGLAVIGVTPSAGDVSICIYCGAFLQYGPELDLLLLSQDEYDALPERMQRSLARLGRVVAKQQRTTVH